MRQVKNELHLLTANFVFLENLQGELKAEN